jgi:site-specific recombinase XerD
VLRKPWVAPDLVKPPKPRRLPDILTVGEVQRLLQATQVASYRYAYELLEGELHALPRSAR